MKIEKKGRVALLIILAVVAFFGIRWYQNKPKTVGEATVQSAVVLPDAPEASLGAKAVKVAFPSTTRTNKPDLLKITQNAMTWQAHNSEIFANGGPETTTGSLFEAAGIDMEIVRQDDCGVSTTQMIKYIQDYKDGKTKDGFFITFMATGIPNYFRSIAEATKALGPEYAPVVFMTFGKSFGEDQLMGDEKYKKNKQLLRGCVIRGVRLDGDLDLALKLGSDNKIPVNQNAKLYYPDAINLSYSSTFLTAVDDYNQNKKETRKIVVNGVTGKDTTVGYDIVATWFPGDERVKNGGRGGVSIISTRDYKSIMPNMTITCRKFLNDNRSKIEAMIGALAVAGDQLRSYDDAKKYACKLGAAIWGEQDEAYWYKYYNGYQADANTLLGGSMAFNLNDMANIFGLNGGRDIYKDVYEKIGGLQSKLYPEDIPSLPDYSKVVDKSFTRSVMDNHPELLEGKALVVDYSAPVSENSSVVGKSAWTIEFEVGKAVLKPESLKVLEEVAQDVNSSDGLKIVVEGHTDNTGSDAQNIPLSQARAQAVIDYLVKLKIKRERFSDPIGKGSSEPVADNATKAGQAKNRRVEIQKISL
jgi:outer membrane protein OmpA-like peptidoglycan-associated protein